MSFNEAGPQGAGKPAGIATRVEPCARFNEAGPQGAGKPARRFSMAKRRPPLQ